MNRSDARELDRETLKKLRKDKSFGWFFSYFIRFLNDVPSNLGVLNLPEKLLPDDPERVWSIFRYCWEQKGEPSPQILMELAQGESLLFVVPGAEKKFLEHVQECFRRAMEEARIHAHELGKPSAHTRPTAKRTEVVRDHMTSKSDFRDPRKVATLFKALDGAGVPLSQMKGGPRNWQPKSWEELLSNTLAPEYKKRIRLLKRNLHPRKRSGTE